MKSKNSIAIDKMEHWICMIGYQHMTQKKVLTKLSMRVTDCIRRTFWVSMDPKTK